MKRLDRIHIRDLLLRCTIGVMEWERQKQQDVLINITLHADLSKAAASDNLNDTVDYKALKKKVIATVEKSSFQLIEALAEEIANICLANELVETADIMIDKPGALRFAKSVAVEIRREKKQP